MMQSLFFSVSSFSKAVSQNIGLNFFGIEFIALHSFWLKYGNNYIIAGDFSSWTLSNLLLQNFITFYIKTAIFDYSGFDKSLIK